MPARMPGFVSRVRGEPESCSVRLFALPGRFSFCFAPGRVMPGLLGGMLPTRAVPVEDPAARGDCLAGSSGGSPRSIPYRREEEQPCRIPNDDIPKRGKTDGDRTIIWRRLPWPSARTVTKRSCLTRFARTAATIAAGKWSWWRNPLKVSGDDPGQLDPARPSLPAPTLFQRLNSARCDVLL